MAKKAKINFVTGDKSFEQGKVYADEAITKDIDESNFEDVSDAALEADTTISEDEGGAVAPTKKKGGKKIAGEELE